eukprot:335867-Chlamydomonas_euryale.AAC.6
MRPQGESLHKRARERVVLVASAGRLRRERVRESLERTLCARECVSDTIEAGEGFCWFSPKALMQDI